MMKKKDKNVILAATFIFQNSRVKKTYKKRDQNW